MLCKIFTRILGCFCKSRIDRHTSCEWKYISEYGNNRGHSNCVEKAGHEQSLKGGSMLVSVPTSLMMRGHYF